MAHRVRVPVVSIGFTTGCIVRSVRNGWEGPWSSGQRSPSPMGDFDWIACFYGTHRLHSALDDLSPAQFKQQS